MKGRALVTGAGKRLGRAMALYLAGRGHDVALHYATSRDGAEEPPWPRRRALGVQAVALQADLLDEDRPPAWCRARPRRWAGR
jgi:NAD(P)-dependent dehydrogenase (short-subunit alcohol dehydrogenase family)